MDVELSGRVGGRRIGGIQGGHCFEVLIASHELFYLVGVEWGDGRYIYLSVIK